MTRGYCPTNSIFWPQPFLTSLLPSHLEVSSIISDNKPWIWRGIVAPRLSASDLWSGHGCITILWTCCSYHYAPVIEQCNLVPVNRRWRSVVGKATVGLASHWPCVNSRDKGIERETNTLPPRLRSNRSTCILFEVWWSGERCKLT